jgi:hypothetical protein
MSDFLYEIGIDASKADSGLSEFVKRTTETLNRIPTVSIKVNTGVATNQIKSFLDTSKSLINSNPATLTAKFDGSKARNEIRALSNEIASLGKGTNLSGVTTGLNNVAVSAENAARSVRGQGDAFDYLGKTVGYSVMHLIEYQLIMRSLDEVAKELANSLKVASEVQLEQTLQGLYNKNINLNQSLANSIVIAKQWGSDITDVQQVIGLWTKNTGDLAAATFLANEAEKLHRASGIDTMEVYKTSIALAEQLGLKLNELPRMYNNIAEAALKIALPLKAIGGNSSQEGIKQIVEGVEETASTLKSLGFVTKSGLTDIPGIVALVAAQLEVAGKNGHEAGKNISNMLAALEGAGKNRRNFEDIIHGAHDTNEVLDMMIARMKELKQGMADKDFGVKTQQYESLNNFLATLERVKKLKADLEANSAGKLDLISTTEMQTAIGQFDQLKTSVQAFSLALGRELLPNAQAFMNVLNTQWLPGLTKSVPLIVGVATSITRLGIGFLAFQGAVRGAAIVTGFLTALSAEMAAVTAASTAAATAAAELAAVQAAQTTVLTGLNAEEALQVGGLQAMTGEMVVQTGVFEGLTAAEATYMSALTGATLETDAFAAAEGTAAVASEALAGGVEVLGTALGTMALRAAAALAPLLAIVAAADMAVGAMDAADSRKNRNFGMNAIGSQSNDPIQGVHDIGQRVGIAMGSSNPLDWSVTGFKLQYGFETPDEAFSTPAAQARRTQADSGLIELVNDINTGAGNELTGQQDNSVPGQLVKALRHAGVDPHSIQSVADLQAVPGIQGPLGDTLKNLEEGKQSSEDSAKMMQDQTAAFNQEMAKMTAGMNAGLAKQLAPGATEVPQASALPGSSKGVATPQEVLSNALRDSKTDYAAAISSQQELQAAARDTAQAIKDQAAVFGYTALSVKQLSAAYDQQMTAQAKMLTAANQQIGVLTAQQKAIEAQEAKDKNGGKSKSKAYQDDVRQLTLVNAALLKASGAVIQYASAYKLLAAEKEKALGTAQLGADLNGAGLGKTPDSVDTSIAEILRNMHLDSKTSGYSDQITSGTTAGSAISALTAKIMKLRDAAKNSAEIAGLNAILTKLGDASKEASNYVDQADINLAALGESINKIATASANKNLDTLGELLGIDKNDLQYVKDLSAGLKEIADKRQELIDDNTKIGDGQDAQAQADRTAIANAEQQLNIQEQLLKVYLAQQLAREKIQDSEIYKATDAALEKVGASQLDSEISHILGMGGNKKKETGLSNGAFNNVLSDWLKSVLGNSQKNSIGSFMDKLFNVPKKVDDATLTATYRKTVTDLLTNIDSNTKPSTSTGTGLGTAATPLNLNVPLDLSNSGFPKSVNILGQNNLSFDDPGGNGLMVSEVNSADMLAAQNTAADALSDIDNPSNDLNPNSVPAALGGSSESVTLGGPGGGGFNLLAAAKAVGTGGLGFNFSGLGEGSSTIAERNVASFGQIGSLITAAGKYETNQGVSDGSKSQQNIGQDISRVGQGISGASEAVQGFQQGGFQGGVEAGLGIWQTEAAINPALAASPVGIGIAAVGGIVAGLIHHDDPSEMPDKYMPGYGQGVANLQGNGNANGVQYQESPSVYDALGGRTEIQAIEETLAGGRPSWMSPQEYGNLMSMFGSSATGSGKLTVGANLSQEKITGASGTSSAFFTPQQMDAAANTFVQALTANMNKALAPILQFNISGAGAPGYMPNVNNLIGATASEQNALRQSQYGRNTVNGTSIEPIVSGNPYSTPGVGTNTVQGTTTSNPVYVSPVQTQPITVQSTIYLDGNVVAQSVNAVNANTANRFGQTVAA